jgi:hypothetical protein
LKAKVAISRAWKWLEIVKKFPACCWLHKLDWEKMAEGKSKGSCGLLALPLQNQNTLCGALYTPALPDFPLY